eukprot:SAG22_NODE_905_length_6570_cov_9.540411_2_plen_450_part_00
MADMYTNMATCASFNTGEAYLMRVRDALFTDTGVDKDVLQDVAPFATYQKEGLDLILEFVPGSSMPAKLKAFVLKLAQEQMEGIVDASGYGWDTEERAQEMVEPASRYLVVRQAADRELVGFADFRFTVQGDFQGRLKGFPALFLNDMQLAPAVQDKGVGKHLCAALQLIAMKNKMTFMMMKTFKGDEAAKAFATSLKGFALDYSFVGADEPIEIVQKCLCPADLTNEQIPTEGMAMAAPRATPAKKKGGGPKFTESAVTPPSEPGASRLAAGGGGGGAQQLGASFAAAMGQFKVLSPEERQQATLEAFYAQVDPSKTVAEIEAILKKRRQGQPKGSKWFEKLLGQLKTKYNGVDPLKVYEEAKKAAVAAAAEEEEEDEDEDEEEEDEDEEAEDEEGEFESMEAGLRAVLEEKLGRVPTEEEVSEQLRAMKSAVHAKLTTETAPVPATS